MLRFVFAVMLCGAVAACAHDNQAQSVRETARAACEQQHVGVGADMETCIEEMSDTIRNARSYKPEPAHRPSAAAHHPQGNPG